MLRVLTFVLLSAFVLLSTALGCGAFGSSETPSTTPDASVPAEAGAGTEDGGTSLPVSTTGSIACTTTAPCIAPQICCRGAGGPQCGADCSALTDAIARLACDDVTDCSSGRCCLSLASSAAGPVLASACQDRCLSVELCADGGACSLGACARYRCELRTNTLDLWACGTLPKACTPL
jgi:hypothetical protein